MGCDGGDDDAGQASMKDSLVILIFTTSALSFLGCTGIIVSYLLFEKLRRAAFKLVRNLAISDLGFAASFAINAIGRSRSGCHAQCTAQATIQSYFELSSVLWTTVMSDRLYHRDPRRDRAAHHAQRRPVDEPGNLYAWAAARHRARAAALHQYGEQSGGWCWIKDAKGEPLNYLLRATYYVPLWIGIAFNLWCTFVVVRAVQHHAAQPPTGSQGAAPGTAAPDERTRARAAHAAARHAPAILALPDLRDRAARRRERGDRGVATTTGSRCSPCGGTLQGLLHARVRLHLGAPRVGRWWGARARRGAHGGDARYAPPTTPPTPTRDEAAGISCARGAVRRATLSRRPGAAGRRNREPLVAKDYGEAGGVSGGIQDGDEGLLKPETRPSSPRTAARAAERDLGHLEPQQQQHVRTHPA